MTYAKTDAANLARALRRSYDLPTDMPAALEDLLARIALADAQERERQARH